MYREPTVLRTLELAVKTEQVGRRFYERTAKKFENKPEVASVFLKLAADEEEHEETFTKLLDQAPPDDPAVASEYGRDEYLHALSISEFFITPDMKEIENVETIADAYRIGIKLELTVLLYYQAVRDVVGPSPVLEKIIEEEKSHFVLLEKELKKHLS
jgi:rubrerythrin